MKCFVLFYLPFAAFVCAIDIMYPVNLDAAGRTTKAVAVTDTGDARRDEARKQHQEDRAKRARVRKLSRKAK